MTHVLVAYGSKRGSTARIAEWIGDELRAAGCRVEVLPARRVHEVAPYDAVVLGGSLYAGRWHPEARAFARRTAASLAGRPVWLFSSGPLDRSADQHDIPPVAGAAKAAGRLRARGHITFGGSLASDASGFITSKIASRAGGDYRDEKRIRAWAGDIARTLRAGTGVPG